MNKILLIITFFYSGILYSQKTAIDKNLITPKDIDFQGCVKKITLKNFELTAQSGKIDTLKTITEIDFSKQGRILKVKKYNNSLNELSSFVEYDDLERIIKIATKDGDKMASSENQYFNKKSEFPDSTTINSDKKYLEKYLNHFKNNVVVKQEHFVNGSLKEYSLYKYNDKNQMIEDLYLNSENDSEETVVSKTDNQLKFYPKILTLYEYKKAKDTLISIKIIPKYKIKEVTKKLKKNEFSLEIKEKYENDKLKSASCIYVNKDSISESFYNYNNKKEIKDFYNTSTTQNSIISKIKNEGYANNQERSEIVKIEVAYDKFKNWIRKKYTKDNITSRIIEREIIYYCH